VKGSQKLSYSEIMMNRFFVNYVEELPECDKKDCIAQRTGNSE
jgi:hypothetical protein